SAAALRLAHGGLLLLALPHPPAEDARVEVEDAARAPRHAVDPLLDPPQRRPVEEERVRLIVVDELRDLAVDLRALRGVVLLHALVVELVHARVLVAAVVPAELALR